MAGWAVAVAVAVAVTGHGVYVPKAHAVLIKGGEDRYWLLAATAATATVAVAVAY